MRTERIWEVISASELLELLDEKLLLEWLDWLLDELWLAVVKALVGSGAGAG